MDEKLAVYFSVKSLFTGKTLEVMEIILKKGPTYQHEISKELKVSDSSIQMTLTKLRYAGLVDRVAATDENTGRLINKIDFTIEKEDMKQMINNFKKAKKIIVDNLILLEVKRDEYWNKRKNMPHFRIKKTI